MALYDFVRAITKSALMVHLKNIPKDVYRWRKDLLDAVVTKNELLDWMESGGTTHTHDTEYISIVAGAGEDNIATFDAAGEVKDSGVDITAIGAGSDTDAIHDNVSGEIQAIAAKSPPVGADIVLIEDSDATWAKKQVTLTDVVALATGVTDHGDLDGLADDDHTQYSLADGTRPFSGTVGGVYPVVSSDLTTKQYVDESVAFVAQYYFTDTAADIGGIYYYADVDNPAGAGTTLASGSLGTGDGQAIVNFITYTGEPGVIVLKQGIYHCHVHAAVTAGTKPVQIYFEVYKRILAGAETLVATSEVSDYVTTIDDFDLHASVPSDVDILTTDRIVIKWLANVEATGSDATITLYLEGTYASRVEIPTTTEVLSGVFVRRDGTTALTADWDAGTWEIRANTFESDVATGTSPLTVASTTVVTNLNAEFLNGVGATNPPSYGGFLFLSNPSPGVYSIDASEFTDASFVRRNLANSTKIEATVKNTTGSTIDALSLCYISGDSSGVPLITLADASAESTSSKMLVITSASISNNATGNATVYGIVAGLSGLTPSAIQWVSTTTGGITETRPSTTGEIIRVVGHALTSTSMFFNPDGFYMEK